MDAALAACLGLATVGGAVMLRALRTRRHAAPDIDEFLAGVAPDDYALRTAEAFLPRIWGIVSAAVVTRLERLLPHEYLANVDRQLTQAGRPRRHGAARHVATQIGLGLAGCLVVALLLPAGPPAGAALVLLLVPVIGAMLPSVRLKRAIRARSEEIFKDLPDIIDMLAVAVEAGSGFEAALSIVCQHFDSPMAQELSVVLREMELGIPRRVALQHLKERADIDVVRTFVLALVQADALGVPIGRVLKSQATEIRARRRAWARERAAKMPVKILFPLILFIFPPILAIVLGPAARTIHF
jgi:tight adherence protein C